MTRFAHAPRVNRALASLSLFLLACGSPATAPVALPLTPSPAAPVPQRLSMEGGDRVQFARVPLAEGATLTVRGGSCRDVFVYLVDGSIAVQGEERPLRPDDAARLTTETEVRALAPSDLVVAYVFDPAGGVAARSGLSAPGCTAVPTENLARCDFAALEEHRVANGKLAVRILFDEENGARLGALSVLAGAPDLAVASHVHETSVEALYILSGSGEMSIGDRQLAIGPGVVAYVPENTPHDLRPAGTTPLRAIQIYAAPGPEQRFRGQSPAVAPADSAPADSAPADGAFGDQQMEPEVTP